MRIYEQLRIARHDSCEVVLSTIWNARLLMRLVVVYYFNMKVKVVLRVANYVWQKKNLPFSRSAFFFFCVVAFVCGARGLSSKYESHFEKFL